MALRGENALLRACRAYCGVDAVGNVVVKLVQVPQPLGVPVGHAEVVAVADLLAFLSQRTLGRASGMELTSEFLRTELSALRRRWGMMSGEEAVVAYCALLAALYLNEKVVMDGVMQSSVYSLSGNLRMSLLSVRRPQLEDSSRIRRVVVRVRDWLLDSLAQIPFIPFSFLLSFVRAMQDASHSAPSEAAALMTLLNRRTSADASDANDPGLHAARSAAVEVITSIRRWASCTSTAASEWTRWNEETWKAVVSVVPVVCVVPTANVVFGVSAIVPERSLFLFDPLQADTAVRCGSRRVGKLHLFTGWETSQQNEEDFLLLGDCTAQLSDDSSVALIVVQDAADTAAVRQLSRLSQCSLKGVLLVVFGVGKHFMYRISCLTGLIPCSSKAISMQTLFQDSHAWPRLLAPITVTVQEQLGEDAATYSSHQNPFLTSRSTRFLSLRVDDAPQKAFPETQNSPSLPSAPAFATVVLGSPTAPSIVVVENMFWDTLFYLRSLMCQGQATALIPGRRFALLWGLVSVRRRAKCETEVLGKDLRANSVEEAAVVGEVVRGLECSIEEALAATFENVGGETVERALTRVQSTVQRFARFEAEIAARQRDRATLHLPAASRFAEMYTVTVPRPPFHEVAHDALSPCDEANGALEECVLADVDEWVSRDACRDQLSSLFRLYSGMASTGVVTSCDV